MARARITFQPKWVHFRAFASSPFASAGKEAAEKIYTAESALGSLKNAAGIKVARKEKRVLRNGRTKSIWLSIVTLL